MEGGGLSTRFLGGRDADMSVDGCFVLGLGMFVCFVYCWWLFSWVVVGVWGMSAAACSRSSFR